jgi:hypothetical protein
MKRKGKIFFVVLEFKTFHGDQSGEDHDARTDLFFFELFPTHGGETPHHLEQSILCDYGLVVNAKKRRVTVPGSAVKMDFFPDVVKIPDEFCHSWVGNPRTKRRDKYFLL